MQILLMDWLQGIADGRRGFGTAAGKVEDLEWFVVALVVEFAVETVEN